jgi:hypothetical protein
VSDPRLHILGIRHHGPGSAASVCAALDHSDPAIVLIEGPTDANGVLSFAASPGMHPPLAILVHDVDDPAKASFSPFAVYSPEWQALHWALNRQRPVRFIDLPAGARFKVAHEEDEASEPSGETEEHLLRDPLSELAEAAGESDGESWWNALVEQSSSGPEVFDAIAEAMATLRDAVEVERPASEREKQREAHMRLEISKALGETEGNVVVVCGAWHVSALSKSVPAKTDRDILKPLTIAKTLATWVPWTDSRLATSSGYGAGVISPGWYRHLWTEFHERNERNPVQVAARWQSTVAHLLRDEGQLTSSASVIEASRLAISLASVRNHPLPGLAEMQDASLAVMCHGDPILLKLIAQRLVIGSDIGEVDPSVPQMPLAEDLARWQKKLRLKPLATPEELAVDLRSEAGLSKSELLHRLLLINVPWGRVTEAQAGRGTFREKWMLVWEPELSVKLAEAVRFGTTIEQAAGNAALHAAESDVTLGKCAELIGACLNANLPEAAEKLTARLQALSVNTTDIEQLLRAAPPLINILRYGTARKIPQDAMQGLLLGIVTEVCVGLSLACQNLSEEAAQAMLAAVSAFDGAMPLLEDTAQQEAWQRALSGLEGDALAAPQLRGFALRRLYDIGLRDGEETGSALSRALSLAVPVLHAGQWLEGFLSRAAQILIQDHVLLGLIDDWLLAVSEDSFVELLPMLRRSITGFDRMERRNLLEQIKRGPVSGTKPVTVVQAEDGAEAFAKALPLLNLILGIEP